MAEMSEMAEVFEEQWPTTPGDIAYLGYFFPDSDSYDAALQDVQEGHDVVSIVGKWGIPEQGNLDVNMVPGKYGAEITLAWNWETQSWDIENIQGIYENKVRGFQFGNVFVDRL